MTENKFKITAIIPTYNRCNEIRYTLDSLLNQTLNKNLYEVIVVDNNSTNDTKSVIEKYIKMPGFNLSYILEHRQGLHFARHTGAKLAKSEILAYTDDDAICDTQWLKELLNVYEKDKMIDAAGGKIIIKWDKEPPSWVTKYERVFGSLNYGHNSRLLKSNEWIFGANFSIRKKVLFEVGGFDPDQIGDTLIGDGEIGLCISLYKKNKKIMWISNAIVWHCQMVSKNATISDIKRRFYNGGICSAYDFCRKDNINSFFFIFLIFKFIFYGIIHKLIAHTKKIYTFSGYVASELASSFYLAKSFYLFRYIFSSNLRKLVKKENWLE